MATERFSDRPFSEDDASFVIAAHTLPHALGFVSAPPDPQRFVQSLNAPGIERRIVLDERGERAGLWIASVHDGWLVELHLIIAAQQGRGIGRFAVRSAKRFAFEEAGAHRLWLEVAARNVAAQRLYESEGFVHEGTYRDGFKNPVGSFEDLRHYGMLASEYVKAGCRRPGQARS